MRYTSAVDGSQVGCAPRIKLVDVSLEELTDWMGCFYGVLEVLKVFVKLGGWILVLRKMQVNGFFL